MAAACHDDQSRPHVAVNYDFLTPVDEGEREREREGLFWSKRDVSVLWRRAPGLDICVVYHTESKTCGAPESMRVV